LLRMVAAGTDREPATKASALIGMILAESGDRNGAVAALQSVVDSEHPIHAQAAALALGLLFFEDEKLGAAHRAFGIAAAGPDPESAALADAALGLVLGRLGDSDGAAEAIERAKQSVHPGAAELAGEIPQRQGHLDPEIAWAAYHLTTELDQAEAEQAWQILTYSGQPEVVSLAAFQLYSVYADRSEFEQAREVVERAIAVGAPEHHAMAYRLLGAVLVDLEEYPRAKQAYQRAADSTDPGIRLDALLEDAKVTAHLGEPEQARALLRRVIASGHPEFVVRARAGLAQMCTEAGEISTAVDLWLDVLGSGAVEQAIWAVRFLLDIAGSGTQPELRGRIAAGLAKAADSGDPQIAYAASLAAATLAQRYGPAQPSRRAASEAADDGLELIQAGDFDAARARLRAAMDSDDALHADRAALALAMLELSQGDTAAAIELIANLAASAELSSGPLATVYHAILQRPGGDRHPVLWAMIAHQQRGREAGLAAYGEAIADPDPAVSGPAMAVFASLAASLTLDAAAAEGMFQRARESTDPLARSAATLWYAAIVQNRPDRSEVFEWLEEAYATGAAQLRPWLGWLLGHLYEDREEVAAARRWYQRVLGSGHAGLALRAAMSLVGLVEQQGDLVSASRVYGWLETHSGPVESARAAWLLGLSLTRLYDLEAARAAFARVPEKQPEPELVAAGTFAQQVLGRDWGAAGEAYRRQAEQGQTVLWMELVSSAADAWQHRGCFTEAAEALTFVTEYGDPDAARRAQLLLGALYNDSGDRPAAIVAWDRAAAGEPDQLTLIAAVSAADARRELDDLDGAIAGYRRVAELFGDQTDDPELADQVGQAVVQLGLAVARKGDLHAVDREALARVAGPESELLLADALRDAGHEEEATNGYRGLAFGAVDGEQDRLLAGVAAARLGDIRAGQGDLAGAIAAYRRCIDLARTAPTADPPDEAWYGLGKALESIGDPAGARTAFGEAATGSCLAALRARVCLGTADPRERAYLLTQTADRDRAVAEFQQLTGVRECAELIVAVLKDSDPVARETLRGIRQRPQLMEPVQRELLSLCRVAAEAGDGSTAHRISRLVAAEGTGAGRARALVDLAISCFQGGSAPLAETYARQALAGADQQIAADAWMVIAGCRESFQDTEEMKAALRAAIDTGYSRVVVDAAQMLAVVLRAEHDRAGAVRVLSQAASVPDPAAGKALGMLLDLLAVPGESGLPEAERATSLAAAAQRALDSGDPELVLAAHTSLGCSARQAGDSPTAERHLSEAAGMGAPAMALYARLELAQLLHDRGREREALEHLDAVIGGPDRAQAIEAGIRKGSWLAEAGQHERVLAVLQRLAEEVDADQVAKLAARHAGDCAGDNAAAAISYYEYGLSIASSKVVSEILDELVPLLTGTGQQDRAEDLLRRLSGHQDELVRYHAISRLSELDKSDEVLDQLVGAMEQMFGPEPDQTMRSMVAAVRGIRSGERGDQDAELASLREAAATGEPVMVVYFGQQLAKAGRVAEARAEFARVVESDQADLAARAMIGLGETYSSDDPAQAEHWFRRAVAVPDCERHTRAVAAMYLGALAKRRRDLAGALPWYQQVIDSGDSEAPLAAAHLGELHYWLGDRDG
ncbi:MAG: tetratricopeptide repeat protein, partial [Micromonosporaceae bacterium]|nr:tetratricopeptide repeat protein [Micromonosporaceae bacterium]